ncbi:MAG: SDR family oxidoreductase [Pyrinomonadaceae bacterium]
MSKQETILLTGFPGFIANRLVRTLADSGHRLLLLVQPSLVERAHEYLRRLTGASEPYSDKFRIIIGDITLEDLGLSKFDFAIAREETTSIFHLAAIYDLAVKRDVAMKINVQGTKNINRFAVRLPLLRKFNYVSTCYVAGKRTGLILEDELEHESGFKNFYEESKYLAEVEVKKLKRELPVTIFRPSVVVGDSQTGETLKYDGIYYLINYLRKFPSFLSKINIGNDLVRLNIVPVDFVVEAMSMLSIDERAVGETLHIADPQPLTTHDLFDEIAKVLSAAPSKITIPRSLVKHGLGLSISPRVTGLPVSAAPYFFIDQTYSIKQCATLLATHQFNCPSFNSYIRNLIDFVVRNS